MSVPIICSYVIQGLALWILATRYQYKGTSKIDDLILFVGSTSVISMCASTRGSLW